MLRKKWILVFFIGVLYTSVGLASKKKKSNSSSIHSFKKNQLINKLTIQLVIDIKSAMSAIKIHDFNEFMRIINKIEGALRSGKITNMPWINFQREDTGNTMLHVAVEECMVHAVEVLLKKKIKIDIQNNDSKTPLDIALSAEKNKFNTLSYNNPLKQNHALAKESNDRIIQLLQQHEDDLRAQSATQALTPYLSNPKNESATQSNVAASTSASAASNSCASDAASQLHTNDSQEDNDEMAAKLAAAIALISKKSTEPIHDATIHVEFNFEENYNPLMEIVNIISSHDKKSYNRIFSIIKRFTRKCKYSEAHWTTLRDSYDSNTLLHIAVKECNVDVVTMFLDADADITLINSENHTPLQLAISRLKEHATYCIRPENPLKNDKEKLREENRKIIEILTKHALKVAASKKENTEKNIKSGQSCAVNQTASTSSAAQPQKIETAIAAPEPKKRMKKKSILKNLTASTSDEAKQKEIEAKLEEGRKHREAEKQALIEKQKEEDTKREQEEEERRRLIAKKEMSDYEQKLKKKMKKKKNFIASSSSKTEENAPSTQSNVHKKISGAKLRKQVDKEAEKRGLDRTNVLIIQAVAQKEEAKKQKRIRDEKLQKAAAIMAKLAKRRALNKWKLLPLEGAFEQVEAELTQRSQILAKIQEERMAQAYAADNTRNILKWLENRWKGSQTAIFGPIQPTAIARPLNQSIPDPSLVLTYLARSSSLTPETTSANLILTKSLDDQKS